MFFSKMLLLASAAFGVWAHPTPEGPADLKSRQERSIQQTFFNNQLNLRFTGTDGIDYDINLDTHNMCGDDPVTEYITHDGQLINTTIAGMLKDLDDNTDPTWAVDMALCPVNTALGNDGLAVQAECGKGAQYDEGRTLLAVAAENKKQLTAIVLKASAMHLACALTIAGIVVTPDASRIPVAISGAALATVGYFWFDNIVTWAKNQNAFTKSDAAIIRLLGQWGITAFQEAANQIGQQCYSTDAVNSGIPALMQNNPLYDLTPADSIEAVGDQLPACNV